MRIERRFLRSRVARRIVTLFIVCALVPTGILAFNSFWQVSAQLREQGQSWLQQTCKAQGMATFERLQLLEHEMKLLGSGREFPSQAKASTGSREELRARFVGLATASESGVKAPLLGEIPNLPELNPDERQHLAAGHALLSTVFENGRPPRVFLRRRMDSGPRSRTLLVAELNAEFLWDPDRAWPNADTWILDETDRVLFGPRRARASFPSVLATELKRSTSGRLEWQDNAGKRVASYWSVFLKAQFGAPRWVVVVSQSESELLQPMLDFRRSFPLVILVSLWVVLLLSLIQIRRSMVPLEKLCAGTQRIASRDFQARVHVTSGDEFENLAESFNTMAARLGRQFHALATVNEIDRSILSTLNKETLAQAVLMRMPDVVPCDAVSISLFGPAGAGKGTTYFRRVLDENRIGAEPLYLWPGEAETVGANREGFEVRRDGRAPGYLVPLAEAGLEYFLVWPIFLKHGLAGIISAGYRRIPALNEEDRVQARQLADQVAVALSNARLLEELQELNWGTLTALARAIDAKSPWTAGHSERVTRMALRIARELGLDEKELEILHRGGLLHDIGKIGTPALILDKPGRLTDEELRVMRDHVRMGARILEPIPGFADVIPIVLQHHEAFDGSGYPHGVAGEHISLHARIFAVADVYDALRSDRPYRAGMPLNQVVDYIRTKSGSQFDPHVVQAFLRLVERENPDAKESPWPKTAIAAWSKEMPEHAGLCAQKE